MGLSAGTKFGSYEVLEPIGAGGMGEVFRAHDTKLNRDVALKVLPDLFADEPERLARFQREAEVLASLNHPNIAAIYGLEESGGTRALVLELVEGPTLADRIAEGAIPLDEALDIVRQIADALEAAHEAGIIHRDLKPANIKVREDGTVKVLDFGLAKALGDHEHGDPSESPTLATAATRAGTIMGTAAYMSPEQAKGKPVDKRADIWAFGVVLFEMLTGKRPFDGEDISETLAFVLTRAPDWSLLSVDLAPSIRTYLKRCLEKDPRQRVRDMGDLRLVMAGAFDTGLQASEPVIATHRMLPWVAAVVAASLLTGLGVWSVMRSDPPEVTRFSYELPVKPFVLAASPDGRRFVYNTADGLYLRALDEQDTRLLLATAAPRTPFFSPDGRSGAFFQRGNLMRLALSDGAAIVVCAVSQPRGAHWRRATRFSSSKMVASCAYPQMAARPKWSFRLSPVNCLTLRSCCPTGTPCCSAGARPVYTLGTTGRLWFSRSPPACEPCCFKGAVTHGTRRVAILSLRSMAGCSPWRSTPKTST